MRPQQGNLHGRAQGAFPAHRPPKGAPIWAAAGRRNGRNRATAGQGGFADAAGAATGAVDAARHLVIGGLPRATAPLGSGLGGFGRDLAALRKPTRHHLRRCEAGRLR